MLSINPKVPLALAVLSGFAMLGVTAWQGYGFWQAQNRQANQASTVISQPVNQAPSTPDVALASLELFGVANQAETPAQENTEDLPETNLRIFLRGVLSADGEFPGSALIEDANRKTDVFLVGDELPGNAKLHSVHPNRVVLDRDGKLENLYFPEAEDRTGMTFAADDGDARSPGTTAPSASGQSAPSTTSTDDQSRREEIRRRLELLRERLRTNG